MVTALTCQQYNCFDWDIGVYHPLDIMNY